MKVSGIIVAALLTVAASDSSLTAGTLTVTGDLQRFSFSYEGNEVLLTVPSNLEHHVKPEGLASFGAGGSGDQLKYRARFSRPPSLDTVGGQWVFSDEAGVKPPATSTPTSSVTPSFTNQGTDVKPGTSKTAENKKVAAPEAPSSVLIGKEVTVQLPKESVLSKRKYSADTSVPESPAAAVIGTTATLVRLNDASDATTQVLNFVDGDGNLRSGFSFAFRPYRVLVQPTLTQYLYGPDAAKEDIRGGRLMRFMSRLDLSLAATVDEAKGTDKRGATLALGLSGYIFNNADSRIQLSQRLAAEFKKQNFVPGGGTPRPTGQDGAVVAKEVSSKQTQAITDEVFASVWNNSYWAFGAAPRWRSATGSTRDFTYDGGAAWTTLAYGFEGAKEKLNLPFLEDKSQLIFHTSYRDRQQTADPNDVTKKIREDVWIGAAQLRIGANNFNVFGESVWEKHRPVGHPKFSSRTYFVGFEKRLATDLWLQLSIGSEKSGATNDSTGLIRTALNYAFGNSIKPTEAP